MKKTFLALILFTTVIICKAQTTHTTDFIKVPLPAGAYKINKQQVDALQMKNRASIKTKLDFRPPYNYKMDNLVISFYNTNRDSINNNLSRKKRFLDELSGFLKRNGNNSYKSIIERHGAGNALVTSNVINNIGTYEFYLQNSAKTIMQAGRIEYPEADSSKAAALLNYILNNAQFTE